MTSPRTGLPALAIVGSRTTARRNARGTGLSVFSLDPGGAWEQVSGYEITNPTFLAVDHARSIVHAVHGDGSDVSTYSVEPETGALALIGAQSTGGRNPAHLALTPLCDHLVVVNHSSGSIVSLPVEAAGTLGPVRSCLEFSGVPGPHRSDQTGSKPHQVVFDPAGRYLLVPDKGLDRIFVCRIDGDGLLCVHSSAATREGAGPRHLAFHPTLPIVYTVDELSSTITIFDWDAEKGALSRRQILPTTDPFDVDDTRAAEIAVHPTGRFVYASNRRGAGDHTPGGPGPDSVAVFRVEPDTGSLTALGRHSTDGIRPRHFTFDESGTTLYVANERSDSITAFTVDADTGAMTAAGTVAKTGSPVCITLLPAHD
ncbi:lactonase family protein [Rhodococcus opacus]|uniref:lactonase family protein n=1 Tax=Rhodococcus opacus TaxID=37919 RepID=UPI001C43FD97|nr:lactonase family protein [Rhodococcus opacus]MBV6759170.1 lactonase family protein [Rhodococcus opacus]